MTVFGSGHQVCTSGTRPSSPIVGQLVYETDTDNLSIWNGTSWTTVLRNGATAGGGLSGSFLNPSIASDAVGSSQIVDASITIDDLATSAKPWGSYFWFLTWGGSGQYQQRTTTFSVPTRSTCIFRISTTSYSLGVASYAQYSSVDGVTGWHEYSRYFHNVTSDHRTYPTGMQSVNLNAGSYTYRLYTASGQYTDSSDFSLVSVFGIPY
jgi:hypothetical protein